MQNEKQMQLDSGQSKLSSDTEIRFGRFNATVLAKVDTGATMSSINAQDTIYNKETGRVTFKSEAITKDPRRSITVDVASTVDISSADGGTSKRYVIQLDIEIGGKKLQSQLFNLSDRDHMEYEVLIGQNILKAGNFVVDVTTDNKDRITIEQFLATVDNLDSEQIFESLRDADFTVPDLIKYIKRTMLKELHGE